MAALTLPWFFWANAHSDGEFFRVFLWHHNIERGYGGSDLRSNPWWFYLPQFAGDFLPWSPLLPLAVWWAHRRGWRLDPDAALWSGLVRERFPGALLRRFKRADYLLPAYPGVALFLGCTVERWLQGLPRRGRLAAAAVLVALAGCMIGGWVYRVQRQLPAREPYRDYQQFAARVRRLAPPPEEVIFFRTEAHALAFRLGRPLAIVVQWGELNERLLRPGTHYIVTPPQCAEEGRRCLRGVYLETVVCNADLSGMGHERPLVLLRATGLQGLAGERYAP